MILYMDYYNAKVTGVKLYRDLHAIVTLKMPDKQLVNVKLDATGVKLATPSDLKSSSLIKVGKKFGMTLRSLTKFKSGFSVPQLLHRIDRLQVPVNAMISPRFDVKIESKESKEPKESKESKEPVNIPTDVESVIADPPGTPDFINHVYYRGRYRTLDEVRELKRQEEEDVDSTPGTPPLINRFSELTSEGYDSKNLTLEREFDERTEYMRQYGEQRGSGLGSTRGTGFELRNGLGPSERKYVEMHGGAICQNIVCYREPLRAGVDLALNLLSLGKWKQVKKNLGFDQMFHLYIIIKLSDGANAKTERNETVQISEAKPKDYKALAEMPAGTTVLSLSDLLKAGLAAKKGSINYYHYDPFYNNCQDYVMSILDGAGLTTPELKAFVKQDIGDALDPWVRKLARTVTDVAGKTNTLVYGNGFTITPEQLPVLMAGLDKLRLPSK